MENRVNFFEDLISLVKEKPELSSLDDAFVRKMIIKFNPAIPEKYASFAQFKKSALCKKIVSRTRKELREVYGVFIKRPLAKVCDSPIDTILQSHQSTQERFDYLPSVYALLFDKLFALGLTKDFSLLDVACGFTPFSLSYFPVRPKKYTACDLSSLDMQLILAFFKKEKQIGSVKAIDVLSEEFLSWVVLQKTDVSFLFKALDSFELRKRNSSKAILTAIPSRFLVVSFALRTLGGKKIIAVSRRSWFEKFCVKQGWTFQTIQIPNELFYLVVKK